MRCVRGAGVRVQGSGETLLLKSAPLGFGLLLEAYFEIPATFRGLQIGAWKEPHEHIPDTTVSWPPHWRRSGEFPLLWLAVNEGMEKKMAATLLLGI